MCKKEPRYTEEKIDIFMNNNYNIVDDLPWYYINLIINTPNEYVYANYCELSPFSLIVFSKINVLPFLIWIFKSFAFT